MVRLRPDDVREMLQILEDGINLIPKLDKMDKIRVRSEAPRASARGICGKAKRNCAEANPPTLYELRRGRLSPFLPVLPHGASWRRRVKSESRIVGFQP